MELLTTFTDKEVLEDIPLSKWVKILPSRLVESPEQECSHGRTHQACARGSFFAAHGRKWPGPPTTATALMTAQATIDPGG